MNIGDKIYANTPSSGSPLGFNTFFNRLESLRQLHVNATGQTNSANLSTVFKTNIAEEGQMASIEDISELNNTLNTLKKSTWYVSNTSGTTTTLATQFNQNFSIPSVGQLITAGNFNTINEELTTLEGVCPVYSGKYSGQYSGQYSTQYSDRYSDRYTTQYSTQYSSQYSGQYSARYSDRYSDRYSSQYSGQYSARYSDRYSDRYSSQYSSQYSSRYSDRYSSRYGSQYSGQYSGQYSRYSSRYAGRYSGQYERYGSQYGSRYSGQYSGRTRRGRN